MRKWANLSLDIYLNFSLLWKYVSRCMWFKEASCIHAWNSLLFQPPYCQMEGTLFHLNPAPGVTKSWNKVLSQRPYSQYDGLPMQGSNGNNPSNSIRWLRTAVSHSAQELESEANILLKDCLVVYIKKKTEIEIINKQMGELFPFPLSLCFCCPSTYNLCHLNLTCLENF